MFATKGWLKATLFVVAILVVSLGTYLAFQVQEADAHHPSLLMYDEKGHKYKWKDGMTRTMSGTCEYCGSSTIIHQTHVREEYWETIETYHHLIGWDHRHYKKLKWARYYWRIDSIKCSNSSCTGGN